MATLTSLQLKTAADRVAADQGGTANEIMLRAAAEPEIMTALKAAVPATVTWSDSALRTANQTYLNNELTRLNNSGKATTEQLTALQSQAKTAGITLPASTLKRVETQAANNAVAAAKAAEAARTAEQKAVAAAEKAEADRLASEAAAAGQAAAVLTREQKAVAAAERETAVQAAVTAGAPPDQIRQMIADAEAAGEWTKNDAWSNSQIQAAQKKVDSVTAEQRAQAQTQRQADIQAAVDSGAAPDQIQSMISAAKAAGEWNLNDKVSQSYVSAAQKKIDDAAAQQNAQAQAQWQQQISQAATPEAAQQLIDQARAAGQWNINESVTQGYVQQAQARADAAAQNQQAFETARASGGSFANLNMDSQVTVADLPYGAMQAYGADINRITDNGRVAMQMSDPTAPGYVSPSDLSRFYRAGDQAAAQLQESYKFAAGLTTPTQFENRFTPGGVEIQGVPDDPSTEADESGWYVAGPQGLQKVGADGQPTGPAIPDYDQFNQFAVDTKANIEAERLRQIAEQKALADAAMAKDVAAFEASLPSAAEFRASGKSMLRAPDGSEYYLTTANLASGDPGRWVRMDQNSLDVNAVGSDTKIKIQDFNTQQKEIAQINNQVYAQQREQMIADQKKAKEGLTIADAIEVMAFLSTASTLLSIGGALYAGGLGAAGGAAGSAAAGSAGSAAATEAASEWSLSTLLDNMSAGAKDFLSNIGVSASTPVAEAVSTTASAMDPSLLLDAEFLAADAAQLAAQGIGENQIAQVLVSSGADSALANQAAKLAISGADIATITSNVLNNKAATIYSSAVNPAGLPSSTGVTPSAPTTGPAAPTPTTPAPTTPPPGANTSNMIQVSDAAGNPAYMDAGGNIYNANGQLVSGMPTPGPGTLVADASGNLPAGAFGPSGTISPEALLDAEFIAADAAQLARQGIGEAQMNQILVQSGVNAEVAKTASSMAIQGIGVDTITASLANNFNSNFFTTVPSDAAVSTLGQAPAAAPTTPAPATPATAAPTTPTAAAPAAPAGPGAELVAESNFIAADASQLAQQGLNQTQIADALIGSGVDSFVANDVAQLTLQGIGESAVSQVISSTYSLAEILPVLAAGGGLAAAAAGGSPAPTTPPTTPTAAPATPPASPVNPAAVTEAEFLAADASQLAQQGLGQAQIEQALIQGGADSFLAADAAQLAIQGIGPGQMAGLLEQASIGAAPPLPPVIDMSQPYVPPPEIGMGEAIKELGSAAWEAANSLTALELLAIQAGVGLVGAALAPEPEKWGGYAPLEGLPFAKLENLATPGVNPGYFAQAPAQYQTTSPVQSQFYWGQDRPYQSGNEFSAAQYRAAPGAAVQPFGLQQMYTPTNINQYLSQSTFGRATAPVSSAGFGPVAGPVAPV